ncbi:uncharacterized protein LOC107360968 [Tetranychus urticae]|uniref:uncharacterized protein LOC107360968 n=1 Tax=Tetranychus urticae TaxID=32264 RepID=UPI00077BDD4C|nr:uncharacterized protein LOC107360968 [Tetranychus urticae]
MEHEDKNFDVKLEIVNRKTVYTVSKKLICSVVPYIKKMFGCDLLESKENKVELDFDEHVFNAILDWIHSGSFLINMENVINLYEAADYLMLDEHFLKPCLSYFHENFTIKHLPVVLSQVTKVSKFINLGSIENFICHHFLSITNTDIFLNYPVETVEAILKLDLMVYSEYQIFESILKWVNINTSRQKFIPHLLNCVRWSFMDPDDLVKIKNDEHIKVLTNFDSIISSNVESDLNRSRQNFFVSIHRIGDSRLRIKAFDNKFLCFPIGDFIQDDSMPLEFVHGEHISDILFDSGTKGIQIDWIKRTFRWRDFKVAGKTFYSQFFKVILQFQSNLKYFTCYLEDKDWKPTAPIGTQEELLIESNGKFIVIGKTKDEKKWFGLFPGAHESWFNQFKDCEHSFQATVLDDVVYILTKDLEFIQFNCETRSFNKSAPFKDEKWKFNDLILTSHQTNDDKVILVNKSSGKVHVFCINQKEWIEKYRIMNVNLGSNSANAPVDKLIAFTSTFLPMQTIKPLYEQRSHS